MVLETHMKLSVAEPDFVGNFFCPKIGEMGQKQDFFNLLENLVINFYWIWYIMEIYIIFCVHKSHI